MKTATPSFDNLPDNALIRASRLVRSRKHPERVPLIDISTATLWRWVKEGKFPQPMKLGTSGKHGESKNNVTAWPWGEVKAWLFAQQVTAQPA